MLNEAHGADKRLTDLMVLIVEDERPLRILIKTALQGYGLRNFAEAGDPNEALDILKSQNVDIIINHEEMPNLSGIQMTRGIRKGVANINPEIPIIMCSSHSEHDRIMNARNSGINEYLVKPVSPDALYKRLRACILKPRPFVRDDDGYIGPERRWLKQQSAPGGLPNVPVIDHTKA